MIKRITKPLTAAVLALSLAVSSITPTQASANSDAETLGKVLFGALVLYGISEAVKNNKRSNTKSSKHVATTQPHHKTPKGVYQGPRNGHAHGHKSSHSSYTDQRHLPTACVLTHRQYGNQQRTVFGNRCLRNNYRHYASLPAQCYVRFDTVRGQRVGWGPRCLRRAGYSW